MAAVSTAEAGLRSVVSVIVALALTGDRLGSHWRSTLLYSSLVVTLDPHLARP